MVVLHRDSTVLHLVMLDLRHPGHQDSMDPLQPITDRRRQGPPVNMGHLRLQLGRHQHLQLTGQVQAIHLHRGLLASQRNPEITDTRLHLSNKIIGDGSFHF